MLASLHRKIFCEYSRKYVIVNRDTVLNNNFWVLMVMFVILLMVNVWMYANMDDLQQIPK